MRVSVFAAGMRDLKKAYRRRVSLNGVDVTHECQIADDREGWVLLLQRDANGFYLLAPNGIEPVRRRVHGRVVIRRRDR
jgi:hypothetical protein